MMYGPFFFYLMQIFLFNNKLVLTWRWLIQIFTVKTIVYINYIYNENASLIVYQTNYYMTVCIYSRYF